jgi:hypothetical protein
MKKTRLLGVVLSGALAAVPAMAENSGADFHALNQLSLGLTAMSDDQLASIEGGQATACSPGGGVGADRGGIAGVCSNIAVITQINIAGNVHGNNTQSNTAVVDQDVNVAAVDNRGGMFDNRGGVLGGSF